MKDNKAETQNMDEQIDFEQKSKHLLDIVKASDGFATKEIYNGEIILALDKKTGYIFRFSIFKGRCEFDFISDEEAKTISELTHESRVSKSTSPHYAAAEVRGMG